MAPFVVQQAIIVFDSSLITVTVLGFIIGALVMFGTSSMYHFSIDEILKKKWRRADHIGIYIMIAGSYSPFMTIYFWQSEGKIVLIGMWMMALAGAIFKWFATGRFNLISTGLYVLMGLSILWVSEAFFPLLPSSVKYFLLQGGFLYLVGVFFYLFKQWKYHHPVWHLFVMGGAFSHLWSLWLALH